MSLNHSKIGGQHLAQNYALCVFSTALTPNEKNSDFTEINMEIVIRYAYKHEEMNNADKWDCFTFSDH